MMFLGGTGLVQLDFRSGSESKCRILSHFSDNAKHGCLVNFSRNDSGSLHGHNVIWNKVSPEVS